MSETYLQILPPDAGRDYATFYVYLPAGDAGYCAQYRFLYEENPIDASLCYGEGPNNPANRRFYRIREVYIGRLEGEIFAPAFRALQSGEIGFAFREEGAGDFVGGLHGDEVMDDVRLSVDGREVSLSEPLFTPFEKLTFAISSVMTRCNTPADKLIRHTQVYTISGDSVKLHQHIRWIADARRIHSAFTPMLTVQRLDPKDPSRILTDTVEFYGKDGALLASYDTTPHGAANGDRFSDDALRNTPAFGVRVYGSKSGYKAECFFSVIGDSIPDEQISAYLCIRYRKCLDNKIYFDIGRGTAPTAGTVWEKEIVYRLIYDGMSEEVQEPKL